MILAECCVVLSRSTTFFLLTRAGYFLRRFSCIHCSYWKYKPVLSVWLQFKNSKWIIPRWFYDTYSIIFLCRSASWVDCRDSYLSIHCLLHWIVIKDPFFITCNDILEKQVISLPWKKMYCYGYVIFVILLFESMRKLNAQLAQFFYLFKWWQIVDWDVLKSSANSWLFLSWLHSNNSLKTSWLISDKFPNLISSFNDISPEKSFEN